MLSEEIKNKYFDRHRFHTLGDNINELMEYFEDSGVGEFTYKGIQWSIRREDDPSGRYLPGIVEVENPKSEWQFFETWEDLVENFKFPDGKTFPEILFEED